jgi:hypothetical protein
MKEILVFTASQKLCCSKALVKPTGDPTFTSLTNMVSFDVCLSLRGRVMNVSLFYTRLQNYLCIF